MNGNFSFGDYFKEGAIELRLGAGHRLAGRRRVRAGRVDRSGSRSTTTTTRRSALWQQRRRAARRTGSCAAGMKDNYWHMGVPGPGRAVQRDLHRPRARVRPRGRPGGRRGPLPGDLEPRLHAVRARPRCAPRRTSTIVGDAAGQEHRHRHGPGAHRVPAAGRGQHLRDRRGLPGRSPARSELAGRRYGADHEDDVRLRVVADHVRSGLMLIGDGVTPGNEGRGYVLRRMLRRAVRLDAPARRRRARRCPSCCRCRKDAMKPSYPELERRLRPDQPDRVRRGGGVPPHPARGHDDLRHSPVGEATAGQRAARRCGGDAGVPLHDTYGFPIDLTLEMAAEQGATVDEEGFRRLMREQRERAKADAKAKKTGHADLSVYRGLADALSAPVRLHRLRRGGVARRRVAGLLVDGRSAAAAEAGRRDRDSSWTGRRSTPRAAASSADAGRIVLRRRWASR